MGSDHEQYSKTPILTRENHEKWFRKVQFRSQAKGFFYTVEITKHDFAWIQREGGPVSNKSEAKIKGKNTDDSDELLNDVISKFEKLGGSWDIEKLNQYTKDTARFFSYLTDCLSDDDQAILDEFDSAHRIWKHLKAKYTKICESTASTYMSKIQNFPDNFDVEECGIDNAWERLKVYRRKLGAADSTLKSTYPDKALFHILTKSLPKKYGSILDGFRTNPSTSIDERLHILQEKEDDLKEPNEKAHPAKGKLRDFSTRRGSDISMMDTPTDKLCYRCDGDNHLSRDCPYAEDIKAYAIALRKKDERSKKKYNSIQTAKDDPQYPSHKKAQKTKSPRIRYAENLSKAKSSKKPGKRSHGYAARKDKKNNSGFGSYDEESLSQTNSESDDISPVEKVMLTKALISKNNPVDWVLDISATSPMTDQIDLFRG